MRRLLTVFFVICILICTMGMQASAANPVDADFACDYTYGPADDGYFRYGATSLERLTAEQAAQAGIPSGYSGDVLVVKNSKSSSMDFLLDMIAEKMAAMPQQKTKRKKSNSKK